MVPNKDLSKGVSANDSFTGSRAYTFLDSYIYMKNKNHNALFDKNRKILTIENEAIKYNSPKILYNAFIEQARILDSVVVRMRDFSFRIRQKILSDIADMIPSTKKIQQYQYAINKASLIPKFKYARYKILPIQYPNMDQFFNLFKAEIKEFFKISDNTADTNKPLLHSKATNFLINVNIKYANYTDSLFEVEEIKIMTAQRLVQVLNFMQRSTALTTVIMKDFKTYIFYLRQFDILTKIAEMLEPEIKDNDIILNIEGKRYVLTFNDYLVMYKHFSSMIKYLLEIVNFYNNKFFNKIYAIQSNIQIYNSIMDDVILYTHNMERKLSDNEDTDVEYKGNNMTESSYDFMCQFADLYDLVNGNDEADTLLHDDAEESDEFIEPDTIVENEEVIKNVFRRDV